MPKPTPTGNPMRARTDSTIVFTSAGSGAAAPVVPVIDT
jgi:hypothetical protein